MCATGLAYFCLREPSHQYDVVRPKVAASAQAGERYQVRCVSLRLQGSVAQEHDFHARQRQRLRHFWIGRWKTSLPRPSRPLQFSPRQARAAWIRGSRTGSCMLRSDRRGCRVSSEALPVACAVSDLVRRFPQSPDDEVSVQGSGVNFALQVRSLQACIRTASYMYTCILAVLAM